MKLQQKEVAQMIGVDECSIYNWENNRNSPRVQHIPKINEFLGSLPHSVQPKTLGEMIVHSHRIRGLSQENLAHYLGVDPGTLANWEQDKRRPLKRYMEKLNTFFTSPNSAIVKP